MYFSLFAVMPRFCAAIPSAMALILLLGSLLTSPPLGQIKYDTCADLAAAEFRKVNILNRTGDPTLMEPTRLSFAPDGRIFLIERRGKLKIIKPGTNRAIVAWSPKVFWEPKGIKDFKTEDGLLGLALDPKFAINKFIYLFYSPMDKKVNRLSRFKVAGDAVDTTSEKMLLEVPVDRDYCCHTGGAMDFDAEGNLYLTTGDNTRSTDQYGAVNENPANPQRDAQRSAGNTNDLRGKILRIRPVETPVNGKYYTVPAGNLFTSDKTKPEIYSMGHRNPYTLHVDKYTGWVHVAEIGPDADAPDPNKGPAQHEEFNLVKKAGNFGWPYFIGNNIPYNDYDYVKNVTGTLFEANNPVNHSVNNTGLVALPKAVPAILSVQKSKPGKTVDGVEKFKNLQGTTAITGPRYYYDGASTSAIKLPPHFDKKLIITDFGASNINLVTFDAAAEAVIEVAKLPMAFTLDKPIFLDIGPDGALYVIEYSTVFFGSTASTKISRIEYTGACRPQQPSLPTAIARFQGGRNRLLSLAMLEGGRKVTLPAGVAGFSLHDLKGARVWSYSRGQASAGEDISVAIPASLGNGLLKVRALP